MYEAICMGMIAQQIHLFTMKGPMEYWNIVRGGSFLPQLINHEYVPSAYHLIQKETIAFNPHLPTHRKKPTKPSIGLLSCS
jgi:hypothetical protein